MTICLQKQADVNFDIPVTWKFWYHIICSTLLYIRCLQATLCSHGEGAVSYGLQDGNNVEAVSQLVKSLHKYTYDEQMKCSKG